MLLFGEAYIDERGRRLMFVVRLILLFGMVGKERREALIGGGWRCTAGEGIHKCTDDDNLVFSMWRYATCDNVGILWYVVWVVFCLCLLC